MRRMQETALGRWASKTRPQINAEKRTIVPSTRGRSRGGGRPSSPRITPEQQLAMLRNTRDNAWIDRMRAANSRRHLKAMSAELGVPKGEVFQELNRIRAVAARDAAAFESEMIHRGVPVPVDRTGNDKLSLNRTTKARSGQRLDAARAGLMSGATQEEVAAEALEAAARGVGKALGFTGRRVHDVARVSTRLGLKATDAAREKLEDARIQREQQRAEQQRAQRAADRERAGTTTGTADWVAQQRNLGQPVPESAGREAAAQQAAADAEARRIPGKDEAAGYDPSLKSKDDIQQRREEFRNRQAGQRAERDLRIGAEQARQTGDIRRLPDKATVDRALEHWAQQQPDGRDAPAQPGPEERQAPGSGNGGVSSKDSRDGDSKGSRAGKDGQAGPDAGGKQGTRTDAEQARADKAAADRVEAAMERALLGDNSGERPSSRDFEGWSRHRQSERTKSEEKSTHSSNQTPDAGRRAPEPADRGRQPEPGQQSKQPSNEPHTPAARPAAAPPRPPSHRAHDTTAGPARNGGTEDKTPDKTGQASTPPPPPPDQRPDNGSTSSK